MYYSMAATQAEEKPSSRRGGCAGSQGCGELECVRGASGAKRTNSAASRQPAAPMKETDEEVEVEEELPWIQDKALDLVEFTGTVTQAIPGPRVGSSPIPWLLALPLAYLGVSFALAVARTYRKFTSPRTQKRPQRWPCLQHPCHPLLRPDDIHSCHRLGEALGQRVSWSGAETARISCCPVRI